MIKISTQKILTNLIYPPGSKKNNKDNRIYLWRAKYGIPSQRPAIKFRQMSGL